MISQNIKQIIDGLKAYKEEDIYGEDKGPLINVNDLTGRASVFYEKIRYMVDYKEEHTIRRSAIERLLKRILLIENAPDAGLALLEDLVASGYLLNKSIPESIADHINDIINKYLVLGVEVANAGTPVKNSRIISLMASEVERFLYPQILNDLVVESFYNTVSKNIKYQGEISVAELEAQIYLGCRRSLLEDDYETSFYALLTRHVPELLTANTEKKIKSLAPKFAQVLPMVAWELESPLGWKMANKLKNYSIYFSVLKEIFKEYGAMAETVFLDKARLENEIREILAVKYAEQYHLIDKSGTRAVIYILLTKVILAFVFELPYEKFILGEINYFALGTNIVFHPLLLYVMVKSIAPVSARNTEYIIYGVEDITSGAKLNPIYIKPPVNNSFLETIFDGFYLVLFALSFGAILAILNALHFNVVSILLFLFFLALVSYFGFRVRYNAKKWRLATEDNDFFSLLWNFFTLPIVRTGRWLSRKFTTVNVFVFIMDFIIEMPFKFILGTFNSFISFLKDKREDPY